MSSPGHGTFSPLLLRSSLPSHCLSPSGFSSHLSSETQKANTPVSWFCETNHPKTQWLKPTIAIYFARKSAFKAKPTTSQSHTGRREDSLLRPMAGKSISAQTLTQAFHGLLGLPHSMAAGLQEQVSQETGNSRCLFLEAWKLAQHYFCHSLLVRNSQSQTQG